MTNEPSVLDPIWKNNKICTTFVFIPFLTSSPCGHCAAMLRSSDSISICVPTLSHEASPVFVSVKTKFLFIYLFTCLKD